MVTDPGPLQIEKIHAMCAHPNRSQRSGTIKAGRNAQEYEISTAILLMTPRYLRNSANLKKCGLSLCLQ